MLLLTKLSFWVFGVFLIRFGFIFIFSSLGSSSTSSSLSSSCSIGHIHFTDMKHTSNIKSYIISSFNLKQEKRNRQDNPLDDVCLEFVSHKPQAMSHKPQILYKSIISIERNKYTEMSLDIYYISLVNHLKLTHNNAI